MSWRGKFGWGSKEEEVARADESERGDREVSWECVRRRESWGESECGVSKEGWCGVVISREELARWGESRCGGELGTSKGLVGSWFGVVPSMTHLIGVSEAIASEMRL